MRMFFSVIFLTIIFGCAGYPVKHLSSDASLIIPARTTKQEVVNYMGVPDEKITRPDGEVWRYYQANKSLLRKTPYIGGAMGYEEYDVVVITFSGEVVASCVYRLFNEQDFTKTGIGVREQSTPE